MVRKINVGDVKSDKCYGCFACSNVCPSRCIKMTGNEEGFMMPEVDQAACVKCGKCLEVCLAEVKKKETAKVRRQNRTRVYAAQIKDSQIRFQSTSGGMFYAFARRVIEKGGCVYGAALGPDNRVIHICAENLTEAEKCMKSKYVQSDLGETYREIAGRTQRQSVLFTGTPCQVAALKKYPGIKKENLMCIENICHGIPSPKVWEMYLEEKTKEHGQIDRIIFRDKEKYGWNQSGTTIIFKNGFVYRSPLNGDPYIEAFLKGYSLRETCYDCLFKGRVRYGDLTIGDFPEVQNYVSRFQDNTGTSMLIINTAAGNKLVKEAKGDLLLKRIYSKKVLMRNWSWYLSYPDTPKRKAFFDNFISGKFSLERCIRRSDDMVDKKAETRIQRKMYAQRLSITRKLRVWYLKYCFKL